MTNCYWPLKKIFHWKFSQKSLKCVHFLIYLRIDPSDLSILKFWFKIHIPGKISNHLIGHTKYFHVKMKYSYSIPPIHKCNGGLEYENFILIKWLEISPGIWILNQNFKMNISFRSICKYMRKFMSFNEFCKKFQGKFFLNSQHQCSTINST